MLSETEAAYLAGIIDGEGCVSVGWRLKKYLTPTLQITNTRLELLEWVKARCGGSIYSPAEKRPNRKPSHLWTTAGQKALNVLREVRPYILLKGEQIDLLLALPRQSTKERDSLGRIKAKMGPEELAQNRELVAKMRELNRRGVTCH